MKLKRMVHRLLIGLMLFSLFIPGVVGAQANEEASEGSLTIHKYEREPGVEQGEAGTGEAGQNVPNDAVALPGVVFQLTQTHAYDASTDRWTAVQDGQVYTKETDQNGEIVIDDIALGRYKVEEIDGPPHVNLNTDTYYVDIPMTDATGTNVNYDVHIYPKNETIRGAVILTKFNGDGEEEVLPGVVFDLYNADGTLLQEALTTDEHGNIVVDGLLYGDYYFQEVATIDGFVLGSQRVDFTITESGTVNENGIFEGTVEEVTIFNYPEPDVIKEIDVGAINRGENVTYTITTELPGDIADYNEFIITDELDARLSYVDSSWSVDGVDASALTFSENGQTLTWEVNDFAALAGVAEISIQFDAKIDEDAPANEVINNKAIIDFENKHGNDGNKESDDVPLTPTAGSLIIIKQDGDSEERLADAHFELRDADGNVVAAAVTDSNGVIDFGELDYGVYTLHETKAPNGYRKLVNPIDIIVDGENSEHTLTVDNFESGWDLPRTGGMGTVLFTVVGLTLMSAAFGLYFMRRRKIA